jgi:hypothetical protein
LRNISKSKTRQCYQFYTSTFQNYDSITTLPPSTYAAELENCQQGEVTQVETLEFLAQTPCTAPVTQPPTICNTSTPIATTKSFDFIPNLYQFTIPTQTESIPMIKSLDTMDVGCTTSILDSNHNNVASIVVRYSSCNTAQSGCYTYYSGVNTNLILPAGTYTINPSSSCFVPMGNFIGLTYISKGTDCIPSA